MVPIKKTIMKKYWSCDVPGCQKMHQTEKTALCCITKYKTKRKNNKSLNQQRKKYINNLISKDVKLYDIKLSDFLDKSSFRTRYCLSVLNGITIAEFLKIPDKQLLKIKNFGKKGLFEIKNLIEELNP